MRNTNDEILRFLDGRFVTAVEATHHIPSFALHKECVKVMNLQVHLPGEQ